MPNDPAEKYRPSKWLEYNSERTPGRNQMRAACSIEFYRWRPDRSEPVSVLAD